MPGYREQGECVYIHACTHVCVCGVQWNGTPRLEAQSSDLQWALDEQKKLYNALTNKARELQNENVALKGENHRLQWRSDEYDAVVEELGGLSDNELFPGFVKQACRAFGKVSKYEEFIETLRAIPSHPNIVAMLENFKMDQLGITAEDIAETNFRIEDKER